MINLLFQALTRRTARHSFTLLLALVALPLLVFAQAAPAPANHGETEVNILSSYYSQDGNNGAVEGGRGTQQLTDLAHTLILNVPLDSATHLSANLGMDYYASASTDRIDQVNSSASSQDSRYHLDLGFLRQLADKRTIVGLGGGLSREYDYLSVNITAFWAHTYADGNQELSIAAQAFFDRATIIRPEELRVNGRREDGTDTRQSYNLNLLFTQVLTQRLQAAVSTELVAQNGLLSTPFHRVYFRETGGTLGTAKTELLPRQRLKYPVGLRLNYYATDLVQLRSYYRFYNDNFGIMAHTLELEALCVAGWPRRGTDASECAAKAGLPGCRGRWRRGHAHAKCARPCRRALAVCAQ